MSRPLHSAPITGASPLLRAGPPASAATVLNASGIRRRRAPSHPPADQLRQRVRSIGTGLPKFRAGAADQARAASMPDTTWPILGHPPGSSRELCFSPVPMPTCHFGTSTAVRLRSPSWSPPDASRAPFPRRSPRRSSANAARGGLTPPPEGRRRRATTFITCTATQSRRTTYLTRPPLLRSWHTTETPRSCA